jgi:hypothetical protein
MKKNYFYLFTALLVTMMSFGLTACGDDEDDGGNGNSSSLVGTWDIVRAVYYVEGGEPEYESGNGAYWVFTANKLTVHDSEDLMNGKSVDYTYRGNKLNIVGFPLYTVTELTSSKLVIRSEEIYGSYNTVEFKKR